MPNQDQGTETKGWVLVVIFGVVTGIGAAWFGVEDLFLGGPGAEYDPRVFILWATLVAIVAYAMLTYRQTQATKQSAQATQRLARLRSEELEIKKKADRKNRRAALQEVLDALQKIRRLITSKLLSEDMRKKNKREIAEGEFEGRGKLEKHMQTATLEMLKENAIDIGGETGAQIRLVADLLTGLQTKIDLAKLESDEKHAVRITEFAELTEDRLGEAVSKVSKQLAKL